MKMTYFEACDVLTSKSRTYDESVKIVYGWVKQDKIKPSVMGDLIIFLYKKFCY